MNFFFPKHKTAPEWDTDLFSDTFLQCAVNCSVSAMLVSNLHCFFLSSVASDAIDWIYVHRNNEQVNQIKNAMNK